MQAEVLIEYQIKSLDKTFTYSVPEHLEKKLQKGMKVQVPFGQGNKQINGFVINIKNEQPAEKLKEIIDIKDKELILNDELLELGKFLQNTYLCTLISAYQTMLPSSLKIKERKSNYQKFEKFLELNIPKEELEIYIKSTSKTGAAILEEFLQKDRLLKKDYSAASVQTLIKKEIIKLVEIPYYRIDKSNEKIDLRYPLTSEQNICYDKIVNSFNEHKVFLLYGCTGSGKTEIYMHLIEETLKQGKTAIMLVPEITLTMQIVNVFYTRFGNDVAILHSALSNGEKYDEYLKIYRGDAHIVVGTRSAIFAPLKNLGIIIIDEEHSDSYKQENTPKYNAIDIAKWRGIYNNIPVVLGSATPTYESYARALKGVYELLVLDKRVNNAKMPKVSIVDMKEEMKQNNLYISSLLKEKINSCLNRNEQIILLLNRRGYGTFLNCDACGHTFKCPNCDISLTYHKSTNNLSCHYCNYRIPKPDLCPKCHIGKIQTFGVGTERLEDEIKELFPNAKVIRMDADTTTKKGSHENIINDFKNEKYNILLGTQMISKGLDFPKVSLVGIINADGSLNIPDFRSAERTFSLLNQVAGRAGRSGLDSEVIIQTFNPKNFTIKMVEAGSYLKNYQYEMSVRKLLKYPPYYYLTCIKICSKDYKEASIEATKIYKYLKENINKEDIILGPAPASVFRVNNTYRFQIVIKYRFDRNLPNILKEIDKMYAFNLKVYIDIDINPYYI